MYCMSSMSKSLSHSPPPLTRGLTCPHCWTPSASAPPETPRAGPAPWRWQSSPGSGPSDQTATHTVRERKNSEYTCVTSDKIVARKGGIHGTMPQAPIRIYVRKYICTYVHVHTTITLVRCIFVLLGTCSRYVCTNVQQRQSEQKLMHSHEYVLGFTFSTRRTTTLIAYTHYQHCLA